MTFQEFQATKRAVADIGAELLQGMPAQDVARFTRPDSHTAELIGQPGLIYESAGGRKYWVLDTGGDECRWRTRIVTQEHESNDLSFIEVELHATLAAAERDQ